MKRAIHVHLHRRPARDADPYTEKYARSVARWTERDIREALAGNHGRMHAGEIEVVQAEAKRRGITVDAVPAALQKEIDGWKSQGYTLVGVRENNALMESATHNREVDLHFSAGKVTSSFHPISARDAITVGKSYNLRGSGAKVRITGKLPDVEAGNRRQLWFRAVVIEGPSEGKKIEIESTDLIVDKAHDDALDGVMSNERFRGMDLPTFIREFTPLIRENSPSQPESWYRHQAIAAHERMQRQMARSRDCGGPFPTAAIAVRDAVAKGVVGKVKLSSNAAGGISWVRSRDANSAAYEAAVQKHNAASRAFREVQEKYRARKIGDDEFLAARRVFAEATREFDVAFAKEQNRGNGDRSSDVVAA